MPVTATLHEAIQREIDDPMTGRVGMHAVDINTGEEILNYDADETFFLASLTKIFPIGTAFTALGANTRFTTRFSATAPTDSAGVLHGDLYIHGSGDPTIGTAAHIDSNFGGEGTSIERIAQSLRTPSVMRVTGRLVADDSLFVPERRRRTDWISSVTYNQTKYTDPGREGAQAICEGLEKEGVHIERGAGETSPANWAHRAKSRITSAPCAGMKSEQQSRHHCRRRRRTVPSRTV